MNSNEFKYTYLDLRFHSHMFEAADFRGENATLEFFRHVLNEERYAIEDYLVDEIYEAFRRQYEEFVGKWNDTCSEAFERAILIWLKSKQN
jgi:hypothetical protein